MDRKIKEADLVIMICTEIYYKRVMGEEKMGVGLGVKWEGNLIYQHLYQNETVNEKFIPVLFEDGKFEHIPTPVQGQTFYRLDSEDAYNRLYWRLTGQHQFEKPKQGQIKKRQPRKRGSLFPKSEPPISSEIPEISSGSPIVTKSDVLYLLYQAYRDDPDEWVASEQIQQGLSVDQEQLQDFILALREKGFLEAKFLGDKALLRITADGVAIMK
jgi:hypothetical protein